MNLLGLAGGVVIDSLDAKRIRPESTQDETGEKSIDVSSDLRASIDHADPLLGIDRMRCFQPNKARTM
jgi:hypothetical protein